MGNEFPPRDGWGPGPWDDEPDHLEWRHAGFPCLIHRGPVGALCGYVGVPEDHPWYYEHYDTVQQTITPTLSMHGGLTYSRVCQGGICHVPLPGEPEEVYWLGFDCSHSEDVTPGLESNFTPEYREKRRKLYGNSVRYRDIAYVQAETNRLAEQAKEAADAR